MFDLLEKMEIETALTEIETTQSENELHSLPQIRFQAGGLDL